MHSQMQSHTVGNQTLRSRATSRGAAVAVGALAALAAWAGLDAAMGGVHQPAFGGSAPQPLPAGAVAVAGLVGGLLAWAALIVTERAIRRGRRTWLAIALAGLILSLGGPLSGAGVDRGDRLALALLHLVVAATVIPLLYRTASPTTNLDSRSPDAARSL